MWRASDTGEEIKEIRKQRHPCRPEAGGLPHPPSGHREGPAALPGHREPSGSTTAWRCSSATECENIILENERLQGRPASADAAMRKPSRFMRIPYRHRPPAAAAPTGWRRSAPSTTLPTSPAPWTSACAWRCRNEVMEKVNKVLYESKLIGYPQALEEQGPHLLPEPRRLCEHRKTTTTTWPWSTATAYKEKKSRQHQPGHPRAPTTSPSPSTSPSPTPRRWAS